MTEVKPLRAAVIGGGVISEQHLKYLSVSPRCRLAAVCDLSPVLGEFARDRFGAERSYTDYERMLEEVQPQVVHVCTPPRTHVAISRHCLDAGADVIVEKPVAMSFEEFQSLWDHAVKLGRRVIEDHNYRFNAPMRQVDALWRTGRLGDIKEVEIRVALNLRAGGLYADRNMPHPSHRLPCGVIHEYITHMCYLALWFMPKAERFDRVAAAWSNHGGGELFKYDDLDATFIVGDVHGRLRFTCATMPEGLSITVRGTRGEAMTDLYQPYLLMQEPRGPDPRLSPLLNKWRNGWSLVRGSFSGFIAKLLNRNAYEGLPLLMDATYAALQRGEEPPVDYSQIARTMKLIDALIAEGNHV